LYVALNIRSLSMGSVSGRTLEISERGFSATLPVEVPIGGSWICASSSVWGT
jgi:hypothetical protein